MLWELWAASLLCTALAYAGAMIGAILLPPLIPAVIDLLLPLLLGVLEFLLFAIVGSQATAFSSVRSVMTAWWFALGGFGAIAALHIARVIHIIAHARYERVLREPVHLYLKRLRRDGFAAAMTGVLGLAIGTLHAVLGSLPAVVDFVISGAVVLQLGVGLYFHRVTARGLRRAFAGALEKPRVSNRHIKPVRVQRGGYR